MYCLGINNFKESLILHVFSYYRNRQCPGLVFSTFYGSVVFSSLTLSFFTMYLLSKSFGTCKFGIGYYGTLGCLMRVPVCIQKHGHKYKQVLFLGSFCKAVLLAIPAFWQASTRSALNKYNIHFV